MGWGQQGAEVLGCIFLDFLSWAAAHALEASNSKEEPGQSQDSEASELPRLGTGSLPRLRDSREPPFPTCFLSLGKGEKRGAWLEGGAGESMPKFTEPAPHPLVEPTLSPVPSPSLQGQIPS